MESSRRQQAQADLGMDFAKEDQKREAALAKEQARADKKAAKREKMMNMPSYRLMVGTAKYMDKYFLDPILGFVLPAGVGDALSSVFAFPFIYYSLCVVMIYKKENELGFSIAKFNFYLEMQEWVGALLVVINGGDLSKTPFRHVTIRSRIP